MRILAKDIEKNVDSEVEVAGWVHRIRELGGITFIILRDRSGVVQLVLEHAPDLSVESVIRVRGIPVRNEKAPGAVEIPVKTWECLSRASADLPFQVNGRLNRTRLDALLENRVLSLRNLQIRAIFKIQATIIESFSAYLRAQDFTEIKTSKIVSGGTEGGTNLFQVEYFGKKVYLASPKIRAVSRSHPTAKPPWGGQPYWNISR
ncbi:hypothetical protein FACS1894172_08680 [Spirochaetia bacterium]|nr:hypothetical protein FACS1894172_08680 [Spirochaetia bacterium]